MRPTPSLPDHAHLTVVDVRSPGEFAAGHVQGSINLPLERIAQDAAQHLPHKQAPLVLCCLSGARSGVGVQLLRQLGYDNVVNGGGVGSVALQLGRPVQRG